MPSLFYVNLDLGRTLCSSWVGKSLCMGNYRASGMPFLQQLLHAPWSCFKRGCMLLSVHATTQQSRCAWMLSARVLAALRSLRGGSLHDACVCKPNIYIHLDVPALTLTLATSSHAMISLRPTQYLFLHVHWYPL